MRMRSLGMDTPKEAVIVMVYFCLVVFLGVLVFIVKDHHEPGCEYSCDAKITATVRNPEFVDFIEIDGWKPEIHSGSQHSCLCYPQDP